MSAPRALPLSALALAAALAGCGGGEDPVDRFDGARAFRDVERQVEIGPRPAGSPGSEEEVRLIARELRRAGLEGVRVQRPLANVVGEIPGRAPGTVVVGAHHDTKDGIPGFLGANDGASGIAVALGVARAFAADAPLDGPSVSLALFDAEEPRGDRPFAEDGARGSRQYVRYARAGGAQGSPPLAEIRAMVLFDLVGDCDLAIPLEASSSPELYERFAQASEEVDGDPAPFVGETAPIGDDHLPFIQAGVPAVDLIDLTFGPGPSPGDFWHTAEDTLDKVCESSLDAVGEAAVRAIPRIR